MYSFRKSKKGFTLIELMVVVAIIAILALLGLRLYSTQQLKAKIAMVKANAGTVQVAIQTHLVDDDAISVVTTGAGLETILTDLDVLQNPFDSGTAAITVAAEAYIVGAVHVLQAGTTLVFTITPCDEAAALITDYVLTAQR